jgi:hypothetical protein
MRTNRTTRIVVYGLAAIGSLTLLLVAGVLALVSPDQTHRAVLVTGAGGGGAGWCSQFIVVASAVEQANDLLDQRSPKVVFTISCNTSVTVRWGSASDLRVKYRLWNDENGTITTTSMRAKDHSGQVTVVYEVEA